MPEPLDLDALAERVNRHHDRSSWTNRTMHALIAELKATRSKHHEAEQGWYDCTLRAERAEAAHEHCATTLAGRQAEIEHQKGRARYAHDQREKAEAAIARVEALCDPAVANPSEAAIYKAAVRAALGGPE